MLPKLIAFAITSGLAGKLWKTYRGRSAARRAGAATANPAARSATRPDRTTAPQPSGRAPY